MVRISRRRFLATMTSSGLLVGGVLFASCSSGVTPTTAPQATAPSASDGSAASPTAPPQSTGSTSGLRRWRSGRPTYIGSMAVFIAMEKGYYREAGVELEFVPLRAATMADAIPFVANGEIESFTGAFTSALVNAVRSGIAIRVICNINSYLPGFTYVGYAIAKPRAEAGDIRTLADLKGRSIAVPNTEGLVAWEVNKVLSGVGLTVDDVELVRMSGSDMPAALANGSVAVARLGEPFFTVALRLGAGVKLIAGDEVYQLLQRDVPFGLVVASERAIADEETTVALLAATMRGARYYNQAMRSDEGKREMIEIAQKYFPADDPTIYEDIIWPGVPEDLSFDVSFLDELQAFMVSRGELEEAVPHEQLVSLSALEKARTLV